MSMFIQDNTKLASSIMAIIFAAILTVGIFLFMFPAPVATLGDSYDPDTGDTYPDELTGAGMSFYGITEDGEIFEIDQASMFPSSVWVAGEPVSNVFASVKTSYALSGFDTAKPVTIRATVILRDWVAGYPADQYFGSEEDSAALNGYYEGDSVSSTIEMTSNEHSATDLIVGRMYFAPQEGEDFHLLPTLWGSTIEEASVRCFELLRPDQTLIGAAVHFKVRAQVTVTGIVATAVGDVEQTIESEFSLNYVLQIALSSGAAPTGTVDVTIGSFSVDGGSGYGDIPVILMLIGGVGFVASLAVLIIPKDALPFL